MNTTPEVCECGGTPMLLDDVVASCIRRHGGPRYMLIPNSYWVACHHCGRKGPSFDVSMELDHVHAGDRAVQAWNEEMDLVPAGEGVPHGQ